MTTDNPYPLWAAISAIKEGMSARAGLADFREAGGKVRDATWYRLFSEASHSLSTQAYEVTAPLDRKPLRSEITTWTVASSNRDFAQFVDVYARDRETGLIVRHPYQVATDQLLTRADAIENALMQFQQHADAYGEQILGAAYVSTYEIVQGG